MDLTCDKCQHVFKIVKKKLAVNCPSCNSIITLKKKKKSIFNVKPTVVGKCNFDFSCIKGDFFGPILFADDDIYFGLKSHESEAKKVAGMLGGAAGGVFGAGTIGGLMESMNQGVSKKMPFKSLIPRALPDDVRYCGKFNSLGNDHRVIVIKRDEILGFKKGWFSATVVCRNKVLIKIKNNKKEIIETLLQKKFKAY